MPRYAELQVTSHFGFLRGASSCEDRFTLAALCGIEALAVCDRKLRDRIGQVAGVHRVRGRQPHRLGRGDRALVEAQHRLDQVRHVRGRRERAAAGAQPAARVVVEVQLGAERRLQCTGRTRQRDEAAAQVALDHLQPMRLRDGGDPIQGGPEARGAPLGQGGARRGRRGRLRALEIKAHLRRLVRVGRSDAGCVQRLAAATGDGRAIVGHVGRFKARPSVDGSAGAGIREGEGSAARVPRRGRRCLRRPLRGKLMHG